MPIEYSIDPARSLVTCTLSDPMDFEQVAASVERLMNDPGLQPGLNFLSDHSALEFTATTDMVKLLPIFLARLGERLGYFRCAVVVPGDESFGMARMAEVFSEESPAEVRAFRSLEQAETWLIEVPES